MTFNQELLTLQAQLTAAQSKFGSLRDLQMRSRGSFIKEDSQFLKELRQMSADEIAPDEFDFYLRNEMHETASRINGLEDLLGVSRRKRRDALRQIKLDRKATLRQRKQHPNFSIISHGEDELTHLKRKERLVKSIHRRPDPTIHLIRRRPEPAIRAVRRNREATSIPRTASASGSIRSGPTAEAGPRSAAGDDSDGPAPPDVNPRAKTPIPPQNAGRIRAAFHTSFVNSYNQKYPRGTP